MFKKYLGTCSLSSKIGRSYKKMCIMYSACKFLVSLQTPKFNIESREGHNWRMELRRGRRGLQNPTASKYIYFSFDSFSYFVFFFTTTASFKFTYGFRKEANAQNTKINDPRPPTFICKGNLRHLLPASLLKAFNVTIKALQVVCSNRPATVTRQHV